MFDRVIDVAPAARAEWLATNLGAEPEVKAEVEALLRAHSDTELRSTNPSEPRPATTSSLEGPGTVIGRYRIVSEIGEGGFGKVYLAQQQEPIQRNVALKIIKPGMDTAQVIARFEAERQTLALMDHDAIAKVYDAGATAAGRPYFVMELVNGIPITRFCDDERLDTTQRIELFVHVCHAIQHAHQKGVVHRDIKPSNLLVAMHDGRPVPKVIDFGIAKAMQPRAEGQLAFTAEQQIVGTPQYMSPEQAGSGDRDIDTRSDIYSLGVVLYELLTGDTPFQMRSKGPASLDVLLRQICEVDPQTPSSRLATRGAETNQVAAQRRTDQRRLRERLRGDLDWIVMKALAKDRTRRYATANGLAMDLSRHLRGLPVEAGPPSVGYRVQKFVRRNLAIVASLGAIFVSLVVGLGIALWQYEDARKNATLAADNAAAANRNAAMAETRERETKAALQREKEALNVANGHRLSAQAIALANEDPTLALLLAIEGAKLASGPDVQAALYAALEHHRETAILPGHDAASQVLDLTADDRFALSSDDSGLILISDLHEVRAKRIYELPEPSAKAGILAAAFASDPRRAFGLTGDGMLYEFAESGDCVAIRSTPESLSCAAFVAKNDLVLAGGADGVVRSIPLDAKAEVAAIARHASAVVALATSADGGFVASLDTGMTLIVTDRSTGTAIGHVALASGDLDPSVYNAATWHFPSLQFDAKAHRLLARARNGQLTMLEIPSCRVEWQNDPGERVDQRVDQRINGYAALAPSGEFVVTGDFTRPSPRERAEGIFVLDAATGRDVRQLATSILGARLDIVFDTNGTTVVVAGNRGTDAWMLDTGARIGPIPSPAHRFGGMRFTHDGDRVIAGSSGGDLVAFRIAAYPGSKRWMKDQFERRAWMQRVDGNGRRVMMTQRATPGVDGPDDSTWVFDAATGDAIAEIVPPRAGRCEYEISRSGRFAVAMVEGQRGELFDLDRGSRRSLDVSNLSRLRFSPDERFLSGVDLKSETVIAVDLETGVEIGRVRSAGFTAQVATGGKLLAIAAGGSGQVTAHSLPDGALLHTIDHSGFAFDVAFAGDGARLATVANDTTALIFDSSTWVRLARTTIPTGDLGHCDFSPDGRYAMVKIDDHLVLLDGKEGSVVARWNRPGLVDARFSADSNWLRWMMLDGSILDVPLDPLGYARSLAPRVMTTEEMTRYEVGTKDDIAARRLELDAAPDSARNLIVRGEAAITTREIERGLELLERAARIRSRLPVRFHLARACGLTLRMATWPDTSEGRANRSRDRDAALADLVAVRDAGYPPASFQATEELAGLRGEPGADWVFEVPTER